MSALYQLLGIIKEHQSGTVRLQALRGIECAVEASKVTALVGPSGSGKSTLLNILGLIERPTAGTISFEGRALDQVPEAELTEIRRRSVGFIFQSFNLIPVLSALENVEYALFLGGGLRRGEIRRRAMETLDALGIAAHAHQRPSQLSGGQRQRVAIARAVVKEPRVVVADEPTANLDSATALQIMRVIHGLKRDFGTTVIVATHDPDIAAEADEVIALRDGLVDHAPRPSAKRLRPAPREEGADREKGGIQ